MVLTKLREDPSDITLFECQDDHLVPVHCTASLDSGIWESFLMRLQHMPVWRTFQIMQKKVILCNYSCSVNFLFFLNFEILGFISAF